MTRVTELNKVQYGKFKSIRHNTPYSV